MPLKPTVREPDRGLRYLEEKLSLYVAGPGTMRRNPALDLLTGRVPDERVQASPVAPVGVPAVETKPAHSHPATVVLPRPIVRPVAAQRHARPSASPWLAPAAPAPKQRVRLVAPAPQSPTMLSMAPRFVAVVLTAGAALGVGLAVRGVVTSSAVPAAIVVERPAIVEPTPTAVPTVPVVVTAPPPPAPTAAPTAVPTVPPPTVAPAPMQADQFRVLVDERFSTPNLPWPNDPAGAAWVANGTLNIEPREVGEFVALGVPGATDLENVVMSGSFKKMGGPAGGGYGLIVRDASPSNRGDGGQEGRFYVFEVGDRGELGVWLRDGNRWVDLLPWTPSDAVRPGQATNELTVSAIGDQLSFLVNGIPVASQRDTMLKRGGVGVFVGGDGNSVAVERIAVRVPR